jgi:uncharacterized protein
MKGAKMRRYTWVAALVGALALLSAPVAAADTATQTLSVMGTGAVFVRPDVADLMVSVSRSGSSPGRALSADNRATRRVVGAIRALGILPSDIQTQGVNVSSARRHGHRVWIARQSLDVRIRQIRLVGRVVDRVTRAGASNLDGPSYSFSDPSAGKLKATRAAIADARRRADDAAAAIGYRVTGVQSLQLDPGSQGGTSGAGSSTPAATGAPTSIHPGTQEVDAQVEVVYTIAPA